MKKNCQQDADKLPNATKDTEKPKRAHKDIKCFNCQQRGHLAVNCPHGAMFCSECPVDYKGNSAVRQTSTAKGQGLYTPGKVEGSSVESIVLDTGCSRTLVRSNLVPQDKVLEGEIIAIRCAHGDTVLCPLILVDLEINGHHIEVEAALSETFPMPVLLGTDVPQLQDFIGQAFFGKSQGQGTEDVFALTTRTQFLRQTEQETMLDQADKLSGMVPMALDPGDQEVSNVDDHTCETQTQAPINQTDRERLPNKELQGIWMSELDDSLFGINKT